MRGLVCQGGDGASLAAFEDELDSQTWSMISIFKSASLFRMVQMRCTVHVIVIKSGLKKLDLHLRQAAIR